MHNALKRLMIPFILVVVALYGCDSSQQTSANNQNRIELGKYQNQKAFGDYIIHVNALTTDLLPADVARNYKIARSKSRVMLNVVITKNVGGEVIPVTGKVETVTTNLAKQYKDMDMREIVEQDAIYYIGEVSVDNEEILIFNIDITPVDESKAISLAYRDQFFTK